MERLTLLLPSMYGDHHVTEVRRILSGLSGVPSETIYASAAWQRVQLDYDPVKASAETIKKALEAQGYAGEADPTHVPPISPRTKNSTLYAVGPSAMEQFVEKVPAWGGAFGPCPGFEVLHPGEVHPADK